MYTLCVICFVMLGIMYAEAYDSGCVAYHISGVLDHPIRSKIAALWFLSSSLMLAHAEAKRNLPWKHMRVGMFFGLGITSMLTSLVTEKLYPSLHVCFAILTFSIMIAVCVVWCITTYFRGCCHQLLIFLTVLYILHGVMLAHEMHHGRMDGVGLYEFVCLLFGFYITFMVNTTTLYHDLLHTHTGVLLLTNG